MIYLNIYLAIWLWCNFEPIQENIDLYFEDKENIILMVIWDMLGCQMCLSLWITFAITHNWTTAMVLALVAQIHSKIIK